MTLKRYGLSVTDLPGGGISPTDGVAVATPVDDNNPMPVTVAGSTPVTSGGLALPYRNINLGATGVSVKGTAGQVYGWIVCNNATTARFLKLYNKATAPVVGTDAPAITVELPPNSTGQPFFPPGIAFPFGIGVGATQLVADADTTAPAANDVVLNLLYA
jgi:hypothetical protein